jgi:ubiquinone/menaquinone biosynthesis C-methylase UbiE
MNKEGFFFFFGSACWDWLRRWLAHPRRGVPAAHDRQLLILGQQLLFLRRLRAFPEFVENAANSAVLDIGCGGGGMTLALKERLGFRTVVGIDFKIAPEFKPVAELPGANGSLATGIFFLRGDAENIPAKDGTFDRALCTDMLEHCTDARKILAEIRRCLKPGGLLFCCFTPYYGPRGGHLWLHIPLPWAHLCLPRNLIRGFITMQGDYSADITAASVLRQFETLNDTTTAEVDAILSELGFSKVRSVITGFPLPGDYGVMEYEGLYRL